VSDLAYGVMLKPQLNAWAHVTRSQIIRNRADDVYLDGTVGGSAVYLDEATIDGLYADGPNAYILTRKNSTVGTATVINGATVNTITAY